MLQRINQIDSSAVVWLTLRRRHAIDVLMRAATRVGDGYVWAFISGVLWIALPDGSAIVRQLAIAFTAQLSVYRVVKTRLNRPRPFVRIPIVTMLVVPPDEWSFPSGHTAAAFVMVTIIGLHSVYAGLVLLPVALMIGLSRVYLGVHYPTDVLAGGLLGILSGFMGYTIVF